jgi:glycosyltransferase involved in cell wall biosynthesis
VRRKPFDAGSLRSRLAFFGARPRSVVDTWSDELAERVRAAAPGCDAVIASQVDMAAYAGCFEGRPALFEEVELGLMVGQHLDAPGGAARLRRGLTWSKHRRYLADLLRRFTAATVASEAERRLLREAAPGFGPVEVIPNCIHLPDYADISAWPEPGPRPEPGRLIFTGAFTYHANYDAARWFVGEVLPRVQERCPDARLTITGDHAGLPLPPTPGVTLAGFVPDIRPAIAGAWASVVPMRLGGGTRLKILEALALGTPVIATAKGAEGLDAEPGRHLLVADDPQAFADATVALLQDAGLRSRLAENGYRLVAERYDWQVVAPALLRLVEAVITGDTRRATARERAAGKASGGATPR